MAMSAAVVRPPLALFPTKKTGQGFFAIRWPKPFRE
jgi:hypothetical protein